MITLYGGGTPNVFKVIIMLSETDLPFEIKTVNVLAQEQFAPEFVALNPNAKIPVIVDSDGPGGNPLTMFESGAILIYLAEKTGKFLPAASAGRYPALQWLILQMASIGPMFGQAIHFTHAAPAGNDYGRERYITEVRRLYALVDGQLAGQPYVAGEEYTIADMAIYPWAANYFNTLGIDRDAYPNVLNWIARLEARPGIQRVQAINKEMFKAGREFQKQADADSLDRFFGRGRYSTAGSAA